MDFADRTVIVTGAARGMGRTIAEAFADQGARVALWGRTAATLEAAAAEIGRESFAVPCDVTQEEEVAAAMALTLARAGRVHALANNAGIALDPMPFLDMTADAWDAVLDVNLRGAMLVALHAARHMAAHGGGAIVHNASIAASAADGPYAHYSASKAGLIALMRTMAVDLAPHRVRVNAVSPGYVRTEMTTASVPPAALGAFDDFARVPQRRLVEPHEIAAAFLFLASDAASAVTGANLVVDGGLTANLFIMETLPTT